MPLGPVRISRRQRNDAQNDGRQAVVLRRMDAEWSPRQQQDMLKRSRQRCVCAVCCRLPAGGLKTLYSSFQAMQSSSTLMSVGLLASMHTRAGASSVEKYSR